MQVPSLVANNYLTHVKGGAQMPYQQRNKNESLLSQNLSDIKRKLNRYYLNTSIEKVRKAKSRRVIQDDKQMARSSLDIAKDFEIQNSIEQFNLNFSQLRESDNNASS